jgi:hypothetical protein
MSREMSKEMRDKIRNRVRAAALLMARDKRTTNALICVNRLQPFLIKLGSEKASQKHGGARLRRLIVKELARVAKHEKIILEKKYFSIVVSSALKFLYCLRKKSRRDSKGRH